MMEIDKSGRITNWLESTDSNVQWIEKEQKRIEQYGDSCEIVTDPFSKKVALFYKHVYFHFGIRFNK